MIKFYLLRFSYWKVKYIKNFQTSLNQGILSIIFKWYPGGVGAGGRGTLTGFIHVCSIWNLIPYPFTYKILENRDPFTYKISNICSSFTYLFLNRYLFHIHFSETGTPFPYLQTEKGTPFGQRQSIIGVPPPFPWDNTICSPLAVHWNTAQPEEQNNRFQLSREQI